MVSKITFEEALRRSDNYPCRYLLIGNGFSIACKPNIFTYGSLFKQANFDSMVEVKTVFEALQTQDFEEVILALETAAVVSPAFAQGGAVNVAMMKQRAIQLKDLLVSTIALNHPDTPNEISESQFQACRSFLSHFIRESSSGKIYTLNYDLLLYWALMHDDNPFDETEPLVSNDGFGRDLDTLDADYVIWHGEENFKQNIHYLHGALHLFDAGAELQKYTWVNTNIRLIEQTRAALHSGKFPLFVSEGTAIQKERRIKHHAYLHHNYKSFTSCMSQPNRCLFIFGHSLAENDSHILRKIARGKIPRLFVSLFGPEDSSFNSDIVSRAEALKAGRSSRYPLQVDFYDAASTKVWG